MPTFKTMSALIIDVQEALSQVSGTDVQTYAEDKIQRKLQEGFNMVRRRAWWPHLMEWRQYTLDGSTGTTTADIDDVQGCEDIRVVFEGGTNRQLRLVPGEVNPYTLTGTRPRFYAALAQTNARRIKVYPITATGTLDMHVRPFEATFIPADTVPFDADCLVNYAAWNYATDDGTVVGQIGKFQALFESTLAELLKELLNAPISLNPYMKQTETEWAWNP